MRKLLYLVVLSSASMVGIVARPAHGLDPLQETGGGRPARTDCYATFKANLNYPAARPSAVRCVDGDPRCDSDATVNGECALSVAVCANSTFNPAACTSSGIESLNVLHAIDDGADPNFDPDLQALQAAVDNTIAPPTTVNDICTAPSTIRVRIKGPIGKPLLKRDSCRRATEVIRLTTLPQPVVGASDSDRLRLTCVPAAPENFGCDAQTLFSGTFDRLQKQLFSTTCAVATCHDSESSPLAADLLLEPGAAYSNLVGHDAENSAAAMLGWKRVTPGSSADSLLYHKVMNDLGAAEGLGLRMPRPPGRRMLPRSLREVIRLWIDAGAPESGWVANTF